MAAGTSVPSPSWAAQQIGKDWPKFPGGRGRRCIPSTTNPHDQRLVLNRRNSRGKGQTGAESFGGDA